MSSEPVCQEMLEEIVGDDREFLMELTNQFWTDVDMRLPQLREACKNFDGPKVQSLSHAIAGSATCVAAETLRERAVELEACGRARTVADAESLFNAFEAELERVRAYFDAYLK